MQFFLSINYHDKHASLRFGGTSYAWDFIGKSVAFLCRFSKSDNNFVKEIGRCPLEDLWNRSLYTSIYNHQIILHLSLKIYPMGATRVLIKVVRIF